MRAPCPAAHLVLPGDGHAACGHFAVERLVFGLQLDAFDRGELLNVQHVFAVDGLRLERTRSDRLARRRHFPPPSLPWRQHTHVRDEGRLQHAGLQAFEVDGSENGVSFDLRGPVALATQPHLGVFGQELQEARRAETGQDVLEDVAASSTTPTHHPAEGLGLLGELAGILLLHLPHQLLHLLPLDLLLPLLKRRLALDHLVQQAAQRPPVGAERVALVFHHLRRWRTPGGRGR